jgi:hypothetical protein
MMIDYKRAARRHFNDAEALLTQGRQANAGQLFGFNAECGLKALLVAHGVQTNAEGDIVRKTGYREHIPKLSGLVQQLLIFPDGRLATQWLAYLGNLTNFDDWSVDHRYWKEADLPRSILDWQIAAKEIEQMMDAAEVDGVM